MKVDQKYYERLAPPGVPEAWLGVLALAPGREGYVAEIAEIAEAVDVPRLKTEWGGKEIVVLKDDPALCVHYGGGLYFVGWDKARPVHLAARRNWFLRYKQILEPHLRDPRSAIVHFYEPSSVSDLLCTMRSTRDGPFAFAKHADWPRCGHCGELMAFIGTLDFRGYRRIGGVAHPPDGALVLHGCGQCGIACTDEKSTSLSWISAEMPLELRDGTDQSGRAIEVGRAYETIEFPTPAFYSKDLSDDPDFLQEWGIYQYFTCPLNKVGGHLHWIQDDETPCDRNGDAMTYIGQFIGLDDVKLGDSGVVYVFFSDGTGETKTVLQCY
jgi:hypothetical protein